MVLVCRRGFRVHRGGLGVRIVCWRGISGLPGRRHLHRQGLARTRSEAGRDGVPPQTTMHLVEMSTYVGFGSKAFEAHGAGFSGRCA